MDEIPQVSKIPQLKNCCCFCRLETGTKIIGFLEAIFFPLPFLLVMFIVISEMFFLRGFGSKIQYENLMKSYPFELYFTIPYLIKSLAAIYLLIGVYKKRPSYVKFWILIHAIFLVLSFVIIVVQSTFIIFGVLNEVLLIEYIATSFLLYSILIVYNYHQELKTNESATRTEDRVPFSQLES